MNRNLSTFEVQSLVTPGTDKQKLYKSRLKITSFLSYSYSMTSIYEGHIQYFTITITLLSNKIAT